MKTDLPARRLTFLPALGRGTARGVAAGFLAVGTAVLGACAGRVVAEGSWQKDAVRGQAYQRILVVGLSPDYNTRCAFEWSMAGVLKSEHTDAMPSCSRLKSEDELSRENIVRIVKDTGADAVLTTVLVEKTYAAKDGGSRDTRGTAGYKATDSELGTAYGYGPYSYGAYGVPVTVIYGQFVTTAPLTSLSSSVRVGSMLYEATAGSPVYAVEVSAGDLHGRDSALASITPTIAAKLRQDGLVR
jgi:hypothetical protein